MQADIFDHIMAVVPEFDLQVFQEPSGADFQKIAIPKIGDLKHWISWYFFKELEVEGFTCDFKYTTEFKIPVLFK